MSLSEYYLFLVKFEHIFLLEKTLRFIFYQTEYQDFSLQCLTKK